MIRSIQFGFDDRVYNDFHEEIHRYEIQIYRRNKNNNNYSKCNIISWLLFLKHFF